MLDIWLTSLYLYRFCYRIILSKLFTEHENKFKNYNSDSAEGA